MSAYPTDTRTLLQWVQVFMQFNQYMDARVRV